MWRGIFLGKSRTFSRVQIRFSSERQLPCVFEELRRTSEVRLAESVKGFVHFDQARLRRFHDDSEGAGGEDIQRFRNFRSLTFIDQQKDRTPLQSQLNCVSLSRIEVSRQRLVRGLFRSAHFNPRRKLLRPESNHRRGPTLEQFSVNGRRDQNCFK